MLNLNLETKERQEVKIEDIYVPQTWANSEACLCHGCVTTSPDHLVHLLSGMLVPCWQKYLKIWNWGPGHYTMTCWPSEKAKWENIYHKAWCAYQTQSISNLSYYLCWAWFGWTKRHFLCEYFLVNVLNCRLQMNFQINV